MNDQYRERMHAWNVRADREFAERQAVKRLAEHYAEMLDIERNGQLNLFNPTPIPAPVVHKHMRQIELYDLKEKTRSRRAYGRERMREIQQLLTK